MIAQSSLTLKGFFLPPGCTSGIRGRQREQQEAGGTRLRALPHAADPGTTAYGDRRSPTTGRWAETFRHLLLPAPAILVVRVLWDVAPVRIMLPARERATAAEEWSRPVQSSWITRLLCSSGARRGEAPRS